MLVNDGTQVNVMVDIESLDVTPNATILSIGAVCMESGEEFYVEINPKQNRGVSIDTLKFWFAQPIRPPLNGVYPLAEALRGFSMFLSEQTVDGKKLNLWANGITFDIVTLEDACFQCDVPVYWKYNSTRDYRTVREMFPSVRAPEFQGDRHNALADAKYQAAHLKKIFNLLKIGMHQNEN